MKTFKLLQLYPSLPKSWEVGMEVCLGDRNYGYSPCAGYRTNYVLFNNEVENNSEFWDEMIEKEYEILSFSKDDWKDLAILKNDGNYHLKCGTNWSLDCLLNQGYSVKTGKININSLKRLSDGVVFTVGDTIESLSSSKSFIITHFSFDIDEEYICGKNRSCYLKYGIKLKQALFTTNDGVEIFDGDSFWFIYPQFTIGFVEKAYEALIGDLGTFSTEIAAKKFIKENEKKYSLNDMTKIANHWAFIKGQPNNDNILKIIEKWNIEQ